MKLSRLNARGVAHHFVLALAVVGIISAFAFQQVAGSAMTTPSDGPTTVTKPSTTNTKAKVKAKQYDPARCKSSSRPLIKGGTHSNCAAKAQQLLGGLTVDGKFGKLSYARTVEFQKSKNLQVDGQVGRCTWKALYKESLVGCTTQIRGSAASNPTPLRGYCAYQLRVEGRGFTSVVSLMTKAQCDNKSGRFGSTATGTCAYRERTEGSASTAMTTSMTDRQCAAKSGKFTPTKVN